MYSFFLCVHNLEVTRYAYEVEAAVLPRRRRLIEKKNEYLRLLSSSFLSTLASLRFLVSFIILGNDENDCDMLLPLIHVSTDDNHPSHHNHVPFIRNSKPILQYTHRSCCSLSLMPLSTNPSIHELNSSLISAGST